MASFWEQVKQLFERAEESSPAHPAVHEMIERGPEESADFDRWKNTLAKRRLIDWLMDQYAVYLSDGRQDRSIDFLDTPSSKGFVIHFHETNYTKAEVTHFFHYLKERVQSLEYRLQISDRRIFSRSGWVETQERHYLKPRNKYAEGEAINQRFGNITIELELRDDQVRNLRLRATIYKDALYREGENFGALMSAL
ncbi:hypothetical protein CEQ90_15870 [Lewinellaceae bacterium SD302]|nr:hypothetical protein CEQ90_15870 [Lewinellaceae bacterium SD302]